MVPVPSITALWIDVIQVPARSRSIIAMHAKVLSGHSSSGSSMTPGP